MKLTKEQRERFVEDLEIDGYTIIQNTLTSKSIDQYDSNEHEVIIKNNEGQFYRFFYEEWIGPNLEADDIDEELVEVFPKQIIITIYE